jgi:Ca-activated chloride channel family protein
VEAGKDYYSLLGVPRNATPEQLRRAYREAAHQLHPDKNIAPGETELFLEVSQAYETLIDAESRTAYDAELAELEEKLASESPFSYSIQHSKPAILRLEEPQVHYVMIDIKGSDTLPDYRPPINLSIVIDRSTSMQGERLDQVRSAVTAILRDLQPEDSASVVAFSDKAEVIVSPDQAKDMSAARARLSLMQAFGGTEIAQGLSLGLDELHRNYNREGINHIVLLTDGRTYGDEDLCFELAEDAMKYGITINGVGIGSDWSDRFLDELSSKTGGSVLFLNTPKAVTDLLSGIYDDLSQIVAKKVRMEGATGQAVDLRELFRLLPDPMPLSDTLPVTLGNLPKNSSIRILLELVVHPAPGLSQLPVAQLKISGELVGRGLEPQEVPLSIELPLTDEPELDPPPKEIASALNLLSLYKQQEKARHEAELGELAKAARRLENLATQLLAAGERELAKTALNEAVTISQSKKISEEGEKTLKYGTRALLLPAPAKSS